MTTTERIETLRREAAEAGDLSMVKICERALERGERSKAWRECLRALAEGDAQIDTDEPPTPRERWEAAATPVFRVMLDGENPENAQVRQLEDGTWLHSDDLDGVVEVDADDVARWELEQYTIEEER
jgi:hypothetical protein